MTNCVLMKFDNIRLKHGIVVKSMKMPRRAILEDINFIKSKSQKPKLNLYICDPEFTHMPMPIIKDMASSTNGIGRVVIEKGELLILTCDDPDGRCKASGYLTGVFN